MKQSLLLMLALFSIACTGNDVTDPSDNDTEDSGDSDTEDSDTEDSDTEDSDEPVDIVELLEGAGFDVTLAGTTDDGAQQFELTLEQLNDHDDDAAGTHVHNLTLVHRGFDRPMNLVSTGYENYLGFRELQLTAVLKSNQIVLDKRFHNGGGTDWSLFTREQVAADAHDVVERLKPVYTEAWISSGFSNGGTDVVSFRQKYPDDVVGTVALGAPFMRSNDERFLAFFDSVDASCQDKLEAIQFEVLGTRRSVIEPTIIGMSVDGGDAFTRVESERAFEAAALSYPWLFWQYWGSEADCDALPEAATADDDALVDAFFAKTNAFGVYPMSDAYLGFFGAYFFEAQQTGGWPAMPREELESAGLIGPELVDMEVGLVPDAVTPPEFDSEANDALREFGTHSDGIVYVNSDNDPWSAAAIDLADATGSNTVYWVTNGNHTSDLSELEPADRAALFEQLKEWTGVTPE